MGNEVADASVWQARAAAWELAALSLRYPDAELAEAAAGGEWDEAAGRSWPLKFAAADGPPRRRAIPHTPAACAAGAEAAAGADALLRALRPEATRLFVRRPAAPARPTRACMLPRPTGAAASVREPRSMEVERFMRSCGLGGPEGTAEPLDHVATECELLERLAHARGRSPGFRGRPGRRRPPRRSPAAAYGPSSPGTPKPGCQPSPSAWPPRRAIPSTARRRPTWGRSSGRTLPNRPIPAILLRVSDQVKQCKLPGQRCDKK